MNPESYEAFNSNPTFSTYVRRFSLLISLATFSVTAFLFISETSIFSGLRIPLWIRMVYDLPNFTEILFALAFLTSSTFLTELSAVFAQYFWSQSTAGDTRASFQFEYWKTASVTLRVLVWPFSITLLGFLAVNGVTTDLDFQRALVREMGSSSNVIALRAVEELREEGLLVDGRLNGEIFFGADLKNADLSGANMAGVDLRFADLRGANLQNADFSGADLRYTLLSGTNTRDLFDIDEIRIQNMQDMIEQEFTLTSFCNVGVLQSWDFAPRTNFTGADLRFADFSDSDQSFADFSEAIILDANFSGANLYMADFTNAAANDQFLAVVLSLGEDEELVGEVGNPPTFDRDTMMPNGRAFTERRSILEYVDTESEDFIDLSLYREYVLQPEDERGDIDVSAAECFLPFKIIPYPEREPGPFRPNEVEDE